MMETTKQYTAKDFKSDQYVRWCPGCGNHAILNVLQKSMAELGIPAPRDGRHFGHRLLVAPALLHQQLRLPHHPRTRGGYRHGREGGQSRPHRVANHRRRRLPGHRRQPLHPQCAPQRGLERAAVQQPDIRPHQGPILPHHEEGLRHQVVALRHGGTPLPPRRTHHRGTRHFLCPHPRRGPALLPNWR